MKRAKAIAALGLVAGLVGCAQADDAVDDGRLRVVASTSILADVVQNVAGDAADVTPLMRRGADPHSYEPTLHATRDIAYADAVFTNGLLLEPQALSRTIESTARPDARVVALAEQTQRYGYAPIPLVEDASLDTVWLGLRFEGDLPATAVTELSLVDATGPGKAFAFILGTFGTPELLFDSDGGSTMLPAGAHTHVSWAFSAPGVYELRLRASVRDAVDAPERSSAEQTVTVVVGQDPAQVAPGKVAIEHGHVDIATLVDDTTTHLTLRTDDHSHPGHTDINPADAVVVVPTTTLQPIPPQREFRFLGNPDDETYLLPQAVLGRHVHGELDPHIWHDPAAMKAVVDVVRDELSAIDPSRASQFADNAKRYQSLLDDTDRTVRAMYDSIPETNRNLVTTHHGYAYLGRAYGLRIAGFVTPNPSVEPSPRDLLALSRTLDNLDVPAVFVEYGSEQETPVLTQTAAQHGVNVCPIWGDSLDPPGQGPAQTYVDFVLANGSSISNCLKGQQ
ncbi:anchored repeat ABC transporter, substrate-binding protein [Corynebacterium sp. HMSC067D03]|uniref:anchored repeat ABC transporter, substrate-binding protein n=1 Tax=Corynebacterium sp. HMSC067D03 TaxID=1739289 RepID=UPI0008A4C3CD|nr:anchored repeat ABC transporter, substrate-binding protein [Corynebacterium sp. HMSC067D03]